ncbi:MAG: filamentous hemagglutinin N-terminal domain-containing protein, partial [Desulfamplus sp.]|nr:filamentous hemagglutinin N-terminal domain-containing protein [Desulfamplus sp.]
MNSKHLINLFVVLFAILFLSTSPPLLYADISTDGSVGAAQTLTGPDYAIPETLGRLKGSNLFHSFDKFSIKTEESATFTGSDSIKNVISRVTGGGKSEIDGTLRSNVGKADFYFVNPSGVVFGENAKIDVPAAFHASTGNELKFADGSSFKASTSEKSTLTQAAPESFGFLGTQSASIEVNGSTLDFKPESKVSLTSSKDIAIKGIEKETSIGIEAKQASLTSYGGEIELKAGGDLLLDNVKVESSGNGGGKISLKAKNLTITNNANIGSNNIGDKNAYAGVDVAVENQLEILNGGGISSSTLSEGNAGYVKIDAEHIKINGIGTNDYQYTGIWSDAYSTSQGNAGAVEITVSGLLEILNGGQISSATYSTGDGNNVFIKAGNLRINRGLTHKFTGIWSDTTNAGNAGIVEVSVNGLLEILNGGQISSDTWSIGDGNTVSVNADTLIIDNEGVVDQYTGIWSDAEPDSQGNAGTVEVSVNGLLEILNGGQISSATYS